MKTKLYSALLFAATIGFTSCDQASVEPATSTEAELIGFATVTTSITSGSNNTNAGAPTTTPTTTTTSTKKGCKVTGTDVVTLPSSVTAYIDANYTGASIERAGTTNENGPVVQLKLTDGTRMVVLFDAAGNFVSAGTYEKHMGTEVAAENLPAAVLDYIATNYAGATIKRAATNTAGKFLVAIKKTDRTITGLAFNANGTFNTEVSLKGEFRCGKGHGPKGGKKRK